MKINLFFIVVVPPPLTGMTMANKKMMSIFNTQGYSVIDRSISRYAKKNYVWIAQKNIKLFSRLLKVFLEKKNKDGIYFVPDSSTGLWLNLIFHLPIILLMRGPVIMHHHVFKYCRKKSLPMSLITYLLGSRLLNICLSDLMCKEFSSKYPNTECVSLGNYILVETSHEKTRDQLPQTPIKSQINLGYLSNITKEKGIIEFIEVVNKLNKIQNDYSFKGLIAGPMTKKLENIIFKSIKPNLANFEIIGPVYAESKSIFINRCNLMLFPTKYKNEAYPLTILEFMLNDIPVISTDIGCIPEIIELPENIFSIDSFIESSTIRILDIFSSTEKYHNEIIKTQKRVKYLKRQSDFQLKNLGIKINNLYELGK
jgi:glycosyltransferase involved in cell wall biosynthesis